MKFPQTISKKCGLFMVTLLLGTSLVSCLPQSTTSEPQALPANLQNLSNTEGLYLLEAFQTKIQELKIKVLNTRGYHYIGTDPNAFQSTIRHFYQSYPGFCPLKQGFFPAGEQPFYMTLTGQGKEVRLLLSDQSHRPHFNYLFVEAQMTDVLEISACQSL
jgi:hypothetical protein